MKAQKTIKVSDETHRLVVTAADRAGISMSGLVHRWAADTEVAAGAQRIDLRDISALLDAASTLDEFRDLLHNTIATGKYDWDDPLPPDRPTPKQPRTTYALKLRDA